MSPQLFDDVRNYLDITWEMDAGEFEKLTGIIRRGESWLSGKIGRCDFENETAEKELLMNYVMYVRSGRLSDFVTNYQKDIIALQMKRWREIKDAETAGKGLCDI